MKGPLHQPFRGNEFLVTTALTLTVSIATWLWPMPAHASGLLVVYGDQQLVRANAAYRGYTLAPYRDQCGVAVMSPSDLGETVWIRPSAGSEWFGPCLAVDVSRRIDFYRYVYVYGEIAEIPNWLAARWGFEHGAPGEVAVGACPPGTDSVPSVYAPPLAWDEPPTDENPIFWPYPPQQFPAPCRERGRLH